MSLSNKLVKTLLIIYKAIFVHHGGWGKPEKPYVDYDNLGYNAAFNNASNTFTSLANQITTAQYDLEVVQSKPATSTTYSAIEIFIQALELMVYLEAEK